MEFFRTIKENFILLLGSGLFTYGLFNFASSKHKGIDIPILLKFKEMSNGVSEIRTFPVATYYYYDFPNKLLLTVGAILIVIGILMIIGKKHTEKG